MKLFTKYSRINLLATIIIFLLSSAAFYFAIRYILISQVDEDLKIEQREIETYTKEHGILPEAIPVKDQKIIYTVSDKPLFERTFITTSLYDTAEAEQNSYRVLFFGINVNGRLFNVSVAKSLEGTDDLIHSILLITFTTILLILIASLIINRILLKRLWKPFYDTLETVKDFKIDNKQSLHFPVTKIDEFDFMNQTLKKTTSQAQQDYLVLKEFTENASHEMQTPLSIIRSKLDMLIQGENLSEEQGKIVQTTYQAIEKLSRLNYSLLLLAKIENNQYAETSSVDLKQKIGEKIDAFNELWQNQNISVSAFLASTTIHMNNELADILLNNLLSNATRYNMPGGVIRIELTNKSLGISNNSLQKELDPRRIYSRFYKQEGDHGQNGLGLSIIKQICDVSGFKIDYLFREEQHLFTISWL
jgi:signal transduction histidine kinase